MGPTGVGAMGLRGAIVALAALLMAPGLTPIDPMLGENLDIRVVAPHLPVPRNGSILVKVLAEGWEGDTAILQVSRTDGTSTMTFGGTLRQVVGPYWAWTATEPLEPGAYVVDLAHAAISQLTVPITVVGDADLEAWPVMSSAPEALLDNRITEYANCFGWTGTDPFTAGAFETRSTTYVNVSGHLSFSDPAASTQFLYRLLPVGEDEAPYQAVDDLLQAGPYMMQAAEYCFRIEVMDIATSTVHSDPDATFCAQHGVLPDLGTRDVDQPDYMFDRYQCVEPPAAYVNQWCEINEPCIELLAMPGPTNCAEYYDYCPDAPRPSAGAGGMGGAGGSGGEGGAVADAGIQDAAAGGPEQPDHGGGSSGCAVSSSESPASPMPTIGSLLALLCLLRRARRFVRDS